MNAHLDAVSKAKQRYVAAKVTLEQRLRSELKEQLWNMQTQIDIAVRFAYENNNSKADIMRALGTKDYHTVYASLDRTQHVEEVKGEHPLNSVYSLDPDTGQFTATYVSHGPKSITGSATFDFRILNDGTKWFMSRDSLWNEDFTVRNEAVAALDNRQDGYYYEEAMAWVESVASGK